MKEFIIISSILLIVIIVIITIYVFKHNIHYEFNTIGFISGAPKTGKDLLGVSLSIRQHKLNVFKFYLKQSIQFLAFQRKKLDNDIPLLYSNIPLVHDFGYVKITKELILRKEYKPVDKSVLFIGESSLLANSRTAISNKEEDKEIANQMLLFFKLIGHECNGKVICNSQTIADTNYSQKRVLSNYLYINKSINIPFFKVLLCEELMYSDDNSTINTNSIDIENTLLKKMKILIVSKKYYKNYDYRTYSILTDKLKDDRRIRYIPRKYKNNLKTRDIITFDKSLEKYLKKENSENV